jgi:hypothetical protein
VIRPDGHVSRLPRGRHLIANGDWARFDPSYDEAVDVVESDKTYDPEVKYYDPDDDDDDY